MYKVVVVEDSSLLRKGLIFTTPWEKLKCQVIGEASNGLEGVEIIKKLNPDIVITDIKMPGLDGIDMIKSLKDLTNTVFIIISAYSEFDYAKSALKLGVTDYLLKPIDDNELLNSISNACKKVYNNRQLLSLKHVIDTSKDSRVMLFREYFTCTDTAKSASVQKAVNLIKTNYASDISLKDIAKTLLLSESHISRIFKDETGYTIGDYISNYRMKQACCLLADPSIRIGELAEKVGYKDQRYFSSMFKKIVGVTPKEFRNKLNTINI